MPKSMISLFWMNKKGAESGKKTAFWKSQSSLSELEFAKRSWPETEKLINPEGPYISLNALWSSRKWDRLLNPHRKINTEVLQEFYANAFPSAGFSFSFSTKVGGRTIQFHRDSINEFLGNPLVLHEGQMCRYQESINKVLDMEEISKKILLDGREVERNPYGVAIRYRREDLIPEAQVLLLFILHNIRPRSHTSTFTMDTIQLLYLIMSGK
ncbi:hypothetical protein KIW84_072489 [Lathyrus oleraceus]|uniref:Putative plant transposon protein domain-containing protein n=1 Tax=Pisum sativum TaxID=3888 RepID=A0A9D4VL33_PEA|nr:hypothetical protein KIW84_072489 [Pisum sativum]